VTVLVAGMRPQTAYHLRARVTLSDGKTLADSDHTFTTGAVPQVTFPTVAVNPPGRTKSGGVDLVSGLGPDVSPVVLDTDGSVIWYYYDPSLGQAPFAEPIKQIDNGNFLINYGTDVREVDLQGQIVRHLTLSQLNSSLGSAGVGVGRVWFSGSHHSS
jgi:hypothetical protein